MMRLLNYLLLFYLSCIPQTFLIAQLIPLQKPSSKEFIIDKSYLIEPMDKAKIQTVCDNLLEDKTIPLYVVTIPSISTYTNTQINIEQFATKLYNQWGIGYTQKNGFEHNKGILLLIARNDRKLRIEVGAGYKHELDNECEKIIQSNIITYFKNGKYSEGIYSGVFALDKLVRTKEHFHIISSNYFIDGLFIALGIIVVLCIVSFIRTGKRGVAGSILSMIFVSPFQGIFIGSDYHIGNNYYSTYSASGSFTGGSFGGGFSGGGGASGSW